jgi:hypothetical protein
MKVLLDASSALGRDGLLLGTSLLYLQCVLLGFGHVRYEVNPLRFDVLGRSAIDRIRPAHECRTWVKQSRLVNRPSACAPFAQLPHRQREMTLGTSEHRCDAIKPHAFLSSGSTGSLDRGETLPSWSHLIPIVIFTRSRAYRARMALLRLACGVAAETGQLKMDGRASYRIKSYRRSVRIMPSPCIRRIVDRAPKCS